MGSNVINTIIDTAFVSQVKKTVNVEEYRKLEPLRAILLFISKLLSLGFETLNGNVFDVRRFVTININVNV